MLWLWPSEVAALIGLHPHRRQRHALAAVRRRRCEDATQGRCRWGAGRRWAERCRRQCEVGRDLEWTVLQALGADEHQQPVQRRSSKTWGLSGRLDGWRGRVPVEVKVRTGAELKSVQLCDYIQVQCYLHMLDGPRCMLLAQASAAAPQRVRLHYIVRSRPFWRRHIQPRLAEAAASLGDLSAGTS